MERTRAGAAAIALLALAGGCQKVAPPAPPAGEPTPVSSPSPTPESDARFAYAVTFECDGGDALDIAFDTPDGQRTILVRHKGVAATLEIDVNAQEGMTYKDAQQSVRLEGPGLVWTTGAGAKTCQSKTRALPAPKADGVVRTLTADDEGGSVSVKVGEKFAVALVGVPTAGYLWGAEAPPAFLKVTDGPGGPTSSDQLLPGFAGGNHWEVLIVEAAAAGDGELMLVQKRPWEDKADPDARRFKLKVTAQ